MHKTLMIASLLAASLSAPLMAGHSTTQFVGAFAGANTGCASPGFTSVQAAVNAASAGATVYVCSAGSPYAGTVVISKSLTLTGDSGTVIAGSSTPVSAALLPPQFTTDSLDTPLAVVIVWGSSANVTISNLTMAGPFTVTTACAADLYGVLVLSGASVAMSGDSVENIRVSDNDLLGCQYGVGIQVGRRYWPNATFSNFLVESFVGSASIMNSTVSGYQKNGITVDGPGSSASIRGNTVTGDGRIFYIAQNGIQVSRGAGGDIRNNAVSGNAYTGGAPASSGGILLFGGCGDPLVTGMQVMQNTLTNNDVGIFLNNFDDTCSTAAATMTNDKADSNTITNDAVTNFCILGFSGCGGFVTYQVGIDDIGDNDKVINNNISGIGYVNSANNPSAGIYILPIDTISFPTTAAKVHANRAQ